MRVFQITLRLLKNLWLITLKHLLSFQGKMALPEVMKTDLKNECLALIQIQSLVEPKTSDNNPYLLLPTNPEYNKVICSALNSDKKDLQRPIEKISDLYGDKVIPFNSTTTEIELIQAAMEKISECETQSHPEVKQSRPYTNKLLES